MKKTILFAAALMMVSAPAFASRARLESLGEGKNGSFYIKDQRNIFLNPAHLNSYKKSLVIEYGADGQAADTAAASKPQGLYTNTLGDFVYGVSLGNESDATFNSINGVGVGFITPGAAKELFFAGDAGIKWGASVWHAGNENKTQNARQTVSQIGTRLGVAMDNLEVFTTVALMTGAKGSTTNFAGGDANINEWKGKLGLTVGATYTMDDFTFFGSYGMSGFEVQGSDAAASTKKAAEFKASSVGVGVGHQKEMLKGVTMFSKLEVTMSSTEQKDTTAPGSTLGGTLNVASSSKSHNIPLTLGVEAEAASWWTIRGSVSQSLQGKNSNWNFTNNTSTRTDNASTTVALGSGFKFGSVTVDGLVADGSGAFASNGGFGFGNNMLYRLAATYNF